MSRKLHVLHLVEDFPPPESVTGGAPISTRLQIEALSQHCQVTVLAPRPIYFPLSRYRSRSASPPGTEREPFPGVRVHRPGYLHLPLLWPVTTPLQLIGLTLLTWLRHARGAVLLHGHRGYPMGFVATLAARLLGKPAIWTAHGSSVHTHAIRGEARVRTPVRWALRNAAGVIAVSRELAGVARHLGAREECVVYIPNGVDLRRFPERTSEEARRALGRDPARRLVVCAALLVPVKGHKVLLDAWAGLSESLQDVDLALLGDGPLRLQLEEQARQLGLSSRVHFRGRVPYGEMPTWLAACDALVLPSFGEGTPLVALEALAARRPVVGTRVGGTAEVLDREEYGLCVPSGDARALTAALEQALSQAWDEETLRRRAEDFAWPKLAKRIRDVYEATLAASRGSAASSA